MLLDDERRVIELFLTHDVLLEKIPEKKKKKSPDFFSERGGKLSLFELKTRSGDAALWKHKEKLLSSGSVYAHGAERDIDTGNKMATLYSIQHAMEQFRSARETERVDYCFIIIQLNDIFPELTEERWVKTLFGIGDVTYISQTGVKMKACRSLRPASFFEHRSELDGIFIVQRKVSFFPNPYSPHCIKLEKGRMFRSFPKCLPLIEDNFELPPSLDNRSEMESIRLLEEKYGIRVLSLRDYKRDLISARR